MLEVLNPCIVDPADDPDAVFAATVDSFPAPVLLAAKDSEALPAALGVSSVLDPAAMP